jgi:hypothetical protein
MRPTLRTSVLTALGLAALATTAAAGPTAGIADDQRRPVQVAVPLCDFG